jgi:hypothetical protein
MTARSLFFLILPFPLDDDALAARLIAANMCVRDRVTINYGVG